jgi:hypothetical protein
LMGRRHPEILVFFFIPIQWLANDGMFIS